MRRFLVGIVRRFRPLGRCVAHTDSLTNQTPSPCGCDGAGKGLTLTSGKEERGRLAE